MSNSLPNLIDRRASAFDTIINCLKAANLLTSGLDKHRLDFALPRSPHDDWSTVLEKPMLLSNEELNTRVQLTDTTGDQRDYSNVHTVFHARTFAPKVIQLCALLDLWKKQSKNHSEAAVWECTTEDITDDSIIVYLRYVGMTNKYSGSKRQSADKKS
jgi:hypothetical protein